MSYVPSIPAANAVQNLAASGAVTQWNSTVFVNSSLGPVAITLPASVAGSVGQEIEVIKTSSDVNAVTITANGADTLNGVSGSPGFTLLNTGQSVSLRSSAPGASITTDDSTVDTRAAITVQAANYTALPGDSVILVDATAGPVTVTLPQVANVSTANLAKSYTIKKIDATANAVSVAPSGTDVIEAVNSSPPSFSTTAASWAVGGASYTFVGDVSTSPDRWALG